MLLLLQLLLLLRGRGTIVRVTLVRGLTDDEVVNFGEDLHISAIVHHDYIIVTCIVFMYRGLVARPWLVIIVLLSRIIQQLLRHRADASLLRVAARGRESGLLPAVRMPKGTLQVKLLSLVVEGARVSFLMKRSRLSGGVLDSGVRQGAQLVGYANGLLMHAADLDLLSFGAQLLVSGGGVRPRGATGQLIGGQIDENRARIRRHGLHQLLFALPTGQSGSSLNRLQALRSAWIQGVDRFLDIDISALEAA